MSSRLQPTLLSSMVDADSSMKTWLVAAAVVIGVYFLRCWQRGRDLPPGPSGVPLLGRLPWVDAKHLHLTMLRECEKYGDLCSFYLGSRLFVMVNSYKLMKEMLDDPIFAGRPRLRLFQKMTRDCGIFLVEGEQWSNQRRLSTRILRDFGFGRAPTTRMINDELDIMLQELDEAAESTEPTKLLKTFMLASNSIISEMTLGHRFDRNDPGFLMVNKLIANTLESEISETASFLFPVAERVLDLIPMSTRVFRDAERLHEFFRSEILAREHIMTSQKAEPTCLCDVYLQEKRKAENVGDMETFKEFQLIRVCFELHLAGTDTTARSLEWLMLYMAFHPNIQDRVHKDIDAVVGQVRRPELQDKVALNYTCAVIDESFRKASLVAIGVFHRALEDTAFHGRRIPNDAIIIPLVYGIHHRSDYWEKPNEFYPEHFLDDEGRYRNSPYLMPFLIGRRSCVGESLARMEIFLFFTAIMQRYRVRPSAESLVNREDIIAGHLGSLRVPGDYRLVISRR